MTEMLRTGGPPPVRVLSAFGITERPYRLEGGKGGTYRAGDVILKPAEGAAETRWRDEVVSGLPPAAGFRLARPLRAADGDWLAAGWEAQTAVDGRADPARPDDVIRAGQAFHRAVAAVPRPSFLDQRHDPWGYGEKLAWDDTRPDAPSGPVAALLAARRPVRSAAQIVHGDLIGNVLFHDTLPPAIIDWPAYWRPPAWAYATVVIDALTWHDAEPDLIGRWAHLPEWRQMLVRALLFRIGTHEAAGWPDEPREYASTVERVLSYRG